MSLRAVFLAVLTTFALPAAVGAADEGKIVSVQARLAYESTGVFSVNIAPPSNFTAWNTIIGEGDAREPANDLFVSVTIRAARKHFNGSTALTLMLRSKKGRVIASRHFKGLFFRDETVVKNLYVQDAACLGEVDVSAEYGAAKVVHSLALNCGE